MKIEFIVELIRECSVVHVQETHASLEAALVSFPEISRGFHIFVLLVVLSTRLAVSSPLSRGGGARMGRPSRPRFWFRAGSLESAWMAAAAAEAEATR